MSETPLPVLCRRPFLLALLGLGVALRLYQYACDTSLWFDEISIARNLAHRSAGDLLAKPLLYRQVAPVGFIAVEKLATQVLGPSDLALRLPLLLVGLASLPLFLLLARRLLEGYAVPFAMFCFAIGAPFLRYSAEVKQYGIDITATLALSLIALRLRDSDATLRRCIGAGVAGAIFVWFSQATVFVVAGLGAALALIWLRDRDFRTRRALLTTIPVWAASALAAVFVSMHRVTPEIKAFMLKFWGSRAAFPTWPIQKPADLLWLWTKVTELFGNEMMLRYAWPALYTVLAIVGVVLLWRRNRFGALLLLGPLAVTVAAAAARQYPFRTRLVVFLLPSLLIAAGEAAEAIRRRASRLHPAVGGLLLAGLLVAPVWSAVGTPPPYRIEDYKTVLAYLQAHRQPGDLVYVFPNTYGAIEHYGTQYGLQPADYQVGGCWPDDLRAFLREADRYRGSPRVWFFASSVPNFHPARQTLANYLAAIGVRRESVAVESEKPLYPVSAELFDLSDPARLASATAANFPLVPAGANRPLCGDWVVAPSGRTP